MLARGTTSLAVGAGVSGVGVVRLTTEEAGKGAGNHCHCHCHCLAMPTFRHCHHLLDALYGCQTALTVVWCCWCSVGGNDNGGSTRWYDMVAVVAMVGAR